MGKVSEDEEHIKISFGSFDDSGWDQFTTIARVSAPKKRTFVVEFLIESEKPHETEMVTDVKRELDFYLVEKGEENPWVYARYHCGTGANVYSSVHWSYFPKGSTAGQKGKSSRLIKKGKDKYIFKPEF